MERVITKYADGDLGHCALQMWAAGIVFVSLLCGYVRRVIAQLRFDPARQFGVYVINLLPRRLMKHRCGAIIEQVVIANSGKRPVAEYCRIMTRP